MRIAIWHNLPSGGGKRALFDHVKGLAERGHYLESWTTDLAEQVFLPLKDMIKENTIPFNTPKKKSNDIIKPLPIVKDYVNALERNCQTCAEQINQKNFDILYANSCQFFRTSPIAKYVTIPSVLFLQEPYRWFYEAMPELPWIAPENNGARKWNLNYLKNYIDSLSRLNGIRLQARKELEFAKNFNVILANSVFSRETILRTYNLESKVCYLGIDTDSYCPTGENKENFVIGVGTIYHAKGIDRAVRAVGTIDKEKRPDLIWVGNGAWPNDLEKYKELAKKLSVKFVDKLNIPDNELISLLSRAAAMIYTSRLEPFGLAPLEANACGTPTVGIAEGGVKETIKNGENGFLVNEDNPEALGKLILKFCENLNFSLVFGKNAREYVKKNWSRKFSIDNIESYLTKTKKSFTTDG